MFKRITSILFVVALLLAISPARAAERVNTIPQPRAVTSGWFDMVFAINKQVLSYGQGRFSGDRVHLVSVNAQDNSRVEVIAAGDTVYVLLPGQQRWVSGRANELGEDVLVSAPAAPELPEDAPIFLVGDADVGGNVTSQYQIPVDPRELNADNEVPGLTFNAAAVDFFIGKNDGYLHKVQVTLRGREERIGDFVAEFVIVFSRFNTPVEVGIPPANMVDPLPARTAASRYMLSGPTTLPSWARPVLALGIRELRQGRR